MSYLTSSGNRRPLPAAKAPLRLGVPGFAHPLVAPVEWGRLCRADLPLDWTVLGSASGGPGSRPDPYCTAAAAPLRDAGVRVLGHLDAAFGARPFGELLSDAQRFLNWYKVDGFAVARCPADTGALADVRRVTGALRTLHDRAYLVLLHGSHPVAGYAALADQLVTFTGPWNRYRWSRPADWTADHPPGRFCHLVHSVPRAHLEEALLITRRQGAGTVYMTDRTDRDGLDPWESMPGYWDDFISNIGPGVSE
ncbi:MULTISPECIES: spherulation-specific family 4 protein [Streptomyces]|uniref:spherulation-specific family 4 protein n=1 Tax=Streptomyces TaxID=1883 RepID=UPI0037D9A5F3